MNDNLLEICVTFCFIKILFNIKSDPPLKIDLRMDKPTSEILIARFLSGEISEPEKQELFTWVEASAENRASFDEAVALWEKIETPEPPVVPSFSEFWNGLETRLDNELPRSPKTLEFVPVDSLENSKAESTGIWQYRWALVAAAVLVFSGLFFQQKLTGPANTQIYITQNGERQSVDLADGSLVEMNAASTLEFTNTRAMRLAVLAGQAYFQIEADGRPFIVRTENAEVRVLGTRFDVRTYRKNTRVVVEEGLVAFSSLADSSRKVQLDAGKMSTVFAGNLPTEPAAASTEMLAGWRRGVLIFNNTPMTDVVTEFERIYDAEITFAQNSIAAMKISGVFESQSVEETLNDICLILGLEYRIENERYILRQ